MTTDLRNKLIAQGLLALSQVLFPLITYPIVTEALRAEGLGTVNFADSIVQTVLIIVSLSIPLYGIREIAARRKNRQEESRIFRELLSLQAVFALMGAAGIWIIGLVSDVNPLLLWTGTIALVSSCISCEWFLQGTESFFFISIRTLVLRAIAAVSIYIWVNDPADTVLYYSILTGTVVITMILNWIVILKRVSWSTVPVHPWRHLAKINWLFGCYVLASLYTVTDTLFLGWLADEEAVGHYSFGYRLVRLAALVIPTLGVVFIPRISFHHEDQNPEAVREQVIASQRLIYFFCIPLSLFFYLLAPEIVAAFATTDFQPSVAVIRILSPLPLLVALSHLTGTQILVSVKKEKVFFYFLVCGIIINILLNLLLIPEWEEQGSAFANLTTEVLVAMGTLIYLVRMKYFPVIGRMLLSCLLSSLVWVPVVYFIRRMDLSPLFTLFLALFIGGGLYLLLQFFLPSGKWWRRHIV